jgi:Protein of unknown function (DUF1761)
MLPDFLLVLGIFSYIFIVAIAAIVAFVLGFIWHGLIFGKQWAALVGFSKKEIAAAKKKGMGKQMFLQFVISIVMASALTYVLPSLTEARTVSDLTMTAFWIWLGFIAPVQLGSVIWEKTPFKLYLINTGYYLVSLIVMANMILMF